MVNPRRGFFCGRGGVLNKFRVMQLNHKVYSNAERATSVFYYCWNLHIESHSWAKSPWPVQLEADIFATSWIYHPNGALLKVTTASAIGSWYFCNLLNLSPICSRAAPHYAKTNEKACPPTDCIPPTQANVTELSRKIHATDNQDSKA